VLQNIGFSARVLPHPPAGGSSLPEGALGARAKTTYWAKGFPRAKVNGPLREGAPRSGGGARARLGHGILLFFKRTEKLQFPAKTKREKPIGLSLFLFNYANQGWAVEPICIAPSSALMVPGQFSVSPPQVPVTAQPASTVMDMVAWMASSMQLISTLEPAVIRM